MSQNLVGDGMGMDVKGEPLHTEYDADMDEINRLMLRYLPLYSDGALPSFEEKEIFETRIVVIASKRLYGSFDGGDG